MLFSFEAQVFGKAIAKSDVEETSLKDQERRRKLGKCVYKHFVIFDGETVNLLENEVPKKEIGEKLGINLDRLFRYLTKEEYNKILKMGGMTSEP